MQSSRSPQILNFIQGVTIIAIAINLMSASSEAQCQGHKSSSIHDECQNNVHVVEPDATIDSAKSYRLDELIEIAERNNPRTRIAWEQSKSAAERAGIARSEYFPRLTGFASFGDERVINPFPKPLAPLGYTMVEIPAIESGLALQYNVLDFGRRRATLDASRARWLAASEEFQRSTQEVAYRVALSYYELAAATEKTEAIRRILKTAQVTQTAAEAQLENGRATLPDVLNAKAVTAKAEYDLESASGDEGTSRVRLREALGVEPSDAISIVAPASDSSADTVSSSVLQHVEKAVQQRPDLRALADRIRAANGDVKAAQASLRPSLEFESKAASQSLWPSVSQPSLGDTTQFVWQVGVNLRWEIFDGGARKREVLLRQAELRQAVEEHREKRDEITRDTWIAYVRLRTASRQYEAARTLLNAASSSYESSMEAYGYGVKSLIDVVTAEAQLSQARLALVEARSAMFIGAANLQYTTGVLLEKQHGTAPSTIIPEK